MAAFCFALIVLVTAVTGQAGLQAENHAYVEGEHLAVAAKRSIVRSLKAQDHRVKSVIRSASQSVELQQVSIERKNHEQPFPGHPVVRSVLADGWVQEQPSPGRLAAHTRAQVIRKVGSAEDEAAARHTYTEVTDTAGIIEVMDNDVARHRLKSVVRSVVQEQLARPQISRSVGASDVFAMQRHASASEANKTVEAYSIGTRVTSITFNVSSEIFFFLIIGVACVMGVVFAFVRLQMLGSSLSPTVAMNPDTTPTAGVRSSGGSSTKSGFRRVSLQLPREVVDNSKDSGDSSSQSVGARRSTKELRSLRSGENTPSSEQNSTPERAFPRRSMLADESPFGPRRSMPAVESPYKEIRSSRSFDSQRSMPHGGNSETSSPPSGRRSFREIRASRSVNTNSSNSPSA